MDAKGIIIGFISLYFGVQAVNGLAMAADGFAEMNEGKSLDNPQIQNKGRKAMLFGLIQAGGWSGFLAAIIAAINALNI